MGHNSYDDLDHPREIKSLSSLDIVQLSSGWAHCYALSSNGTLHRWGWIDDIKTMYSSANLKINAPGILTTMQNIGTKWNMGFIAFDNAQLTPSIIPEFSNYDIKIAYVACSAGSTFVISTDGKVYSWGIGKWGNLGHKIYNHYTEIFDKPVCIERLLGHNIVNIAAGYVHTLFLDKTGCLWVCGPGLNGRLGLGIGSRLGEYPIPRPLTPLWAQHFRHKWHKQKYLENSSEYQAPIASITASSMYNNDENDEEQYNYYNYPYYDDAFYQPKIVTMSAGHKHSAILTEDGFVWTFGCGNCGALGHRHDFSDKHWPTLVEDLSDEYIVDISCGQNHTVALSEKGNVYTFGMSRYGQCGRKRSEAFMLQDLRERGCDLTTTEIEQEDRSPFSLKTSQNSTIEDMNRYKDQNDGILLKGDPLAMKVGKINVPKQYQIEKVVAGFYETSLITKCGKVICYGSESERLENEPVPKIYDFPNQRILQIVHGWKHTMCLTEELTD